VYLTNVSAIRTYAVNIQLYEPTHLGKGL
jgi:hypothetical protein